MNSDEVLVVLPLTHWDQPCAPDLQSSALGALESGKVVLLPKLPFLLESDENDLLDPALSGSSRKNISFDPNSGKLGNARLAEDGAERLRKMLDRFSRAATRLANNLLPRYVAAIERGRTSFRPKEISGRAYSPRHDDKRLHVDVFPSRPLHGKRILRLFTNIARDDSSRFWQVGEPFADFAKRFVPRIRKPLPGSAWLYEQVGITKGRRSAYDHFMLNLHDRAKLDGTYQTDAPRADLRFPPGVTWLCFTDQVLHAALAGHGALEQTFYLPVEQMADPARSPLRILEGLAGRALV